MGQRLVRAKAKIRDAGIAFAVPARDELALRLDAVLAAIYAAFGSGWDDIGGADGRGADLAEEATWLGRVVCGLLPQEPEAAGLLALMLHCDARRAARRDPTGAYMPLDRQDVALWSVAAIDEAETLLKTAAASGRPGRFQLEAAIQSVHAERRRSGRTDWAAIALLYEGLIGLTAAIGARVGRAAALAQAQGAAAGLAALDALDLARVAAYQPYWALRADLLRRSGADTAAADAYRRATGLSEDPAVRRFLAEQAAAIDERR
jgi:RNA polymerase sigma-70 factor (ECF subfamily)